MTKRIQQKKAYEALKEIRNRIAKGEPTTFAERNIVKIADKKKRNAEKLAVKKVDNLPIRGKRFGK